MRNLRCLLNEAEEAKLIAQAPTFRKVFYRVSTMKPRAVPLDLLQRIYVGTRFAWHPQVVGIQPADWWQAIIVTAVCTGFRRGVLLALEWKWIDLGNQIVRIPADNDKAREDRVKPLHPVVVEHLLKIRTAGHLVFPFPGCKKTFDREWKMIQRAADPPVTPRVKFHDLKRTCGTLLSGSGAQIEHVQTMLDHASPTTSLKYYVDPTPVLRQAILKMPLPAAFSRTHSTPPDRASGVG